jgi:hypothetical protein
MLGWGVAIKALPSISSGSLTVTSVLRKRWLGGLGRFAARGGRGRTMAPMDSGVVAVTHLFPTERAALVALLGSLSVEQWQAATVCPG